MPAREPEPPRGGARDNGLSPQQQAARDRVLAGQQAARDAGVSTTPDPDEEALFEAERASNDHQGTVRSRNKARAEAERLRPIVEANRARQRGETPQAETAAPDPLDEPTDSDLERFVRGGNNLSNDERMTLRHALEDRGYPASEASRLMSDFDEALSARERREIIRRVERRERPDLDAPVGDTEDEERARRSQVVDAMRENGLYEPGAPRDGFMRGLHLVSYLASLERTHPAKREAILARLRAGEDVEPGLDPERALKQARQQAEATQRSRFLQRGDDGEITEGAERPTGTHYEVLPSGKVVLTSASGTRRAVADGKDGDRVVRQRLGAVAEKLTGRPRADAQATPQPAGIGAPLRDWDQLPTQAQYKASLVFQAVDRLHRLDGMPELHLRPVPDKVNDTIGVKAAGEFHLGGYHSFADEPDHALNQLRISDTNWPDHVGSTIAHEFGHAIDYSALNESDMLGMPGSSGRGRGFSGRSGQNQTPLQAAMNDWRDLTDRSPTMEKVRRNTEAVPKTRDYMTSADEMWARAYAQWVMRYGGDETLRRDLRREQRMAAGDESIPMVWDDDEFEPIARAIEAVMVAKGWRDE